MAARTFTDSAGLTWDVFEVRRASQKAGAVSVGLENGWLAFASGEHKRRLAPFPPRPRIRRSTLAGEGEHAAAANVAPTSVENTVRSFAHDARARGLPAVSAMLELKTLLLQRHPEPESDARDRHLVRRWFVEAYYFERDVSAGQQA